MQLQTVQQTKLFIPDQVAKLALDQHHVVMNIVKGRGKDGKNLPSSGRFYYCFDTNTFN